MSDSTTIRRRIGRITWAFAVIFASEFVSALWLMLGGWPLQGWLRGFAGRSPTVVAIASAFVFGTVVFAHRPRPQPPWACPDEVTVRYGIGLAVFCGAGVVVLAVIRAF